MKGYRRRAFVWVRLLPSPDRVSKLLERRRDARLATRMLRATRAFGRALVEAALPLREPPRQSDALIVGAGLSGLRIAAALAAEGRGGVVVLEKTSVAGGVWSLHGNSSSRVAVSGPAYRLAASAAQVRAPHLHHHRLDILEAVVAAIRTGRLASRVYFRAEVRSIVKCTAPGWMASGLLDAHAGFELACNLVCVCTRRRLGVPRQVAFRNADALAGIISRGLADDRTGASSSSTRTLIVGMGAHAMDLMRTAVERGHAARQVAFLARRPATVMPSALGWLNCLRPWGAALQTHPTRGSTLVLGMVRDM